MHNMYVCCAFVGLHNKLYNMHGTYIKIIDLSRIAGTLLEDLCVFMIISRWILLGMRNVSDKSCRENQNTHFMFSNSFFSKILPFVLHMWKNTVVSDRPQMTIWLLCIACWIPKSTNRNPECVILIAFLRHLWLHESASVLYVHLPVLCRKRTLGNNLGNNFFSTFVDLLLPGDCFEAVSPVLVRKSRNGTLFSATGLLGCDAV